jgi:hypothetical protein
LKSTGTILKPYLANPMTGWARVRSGALLAAVILFCLPYGFLFALFAPYAVPLFLVPILVLAGLAVWALPDLRQAPPRTLERLFWAFLVARILWPNYLAIALPGLPWITLIRLIDVPLAFVLLICVSVSSKFRSRAARALDGAPWVWIFLTGFAVIQVLTIPAASHPVASLQKVLNDLVGWTAIFFASAFVFLRPGRIQAWAAVVWGCALLVGMIGVWENHFQHLPWAGHIPSFLKIQDPSVALTLSAKYRNGFGPYRVESTFNTPLGLSEYLALALPFVLQFAIGRYHWAVRGFAAASAPFMVYVITLTDSRLGLVGTFVSAALFLLFWGARRWRHVKHSLLGPGTVLAYPIALGAMISAILFVGRIRAKFFGGQYDDSNEGRSEMYAKGIPMILKHPWGYGSGNGTEKLGITNPSGMLTIDTYYIAIGLDYGLLGFICFYGAIIASVYYSGRQDLLIQSTKRDTAFLGPLAISMTSFLVIKSVFSDEQNNPLVFMILGAIAALCSRLKATKGGSSSSLVRRSF